MIDMHKQCGLSCDTMMWVAQSSPLWTTLTSINNQKTVDSLDEKGIGSLPDPFRRAATDKHHKTEGSGLQDYVCKGLYVH